MVIRLATLAILATGLSAGAATAQTAAPNPAAASPPAVEAAKPDSLEVFFDTGSTAIRQQDLAVLDRASRIYTDGKPIVMILTASTDGVGSPLNNLRLSQARALSVLKQLVARGIPAERFQILAKGGTEPVIPTAPGAAEPRARRVEIAWR